MISKHSTYSCMVCGKTHGYPYDDLRLVWWTMDTPGDPPDYACNTECHEILQTQRSLQNPRRWILGVRR